MTLANDGLIREQLTRRSFLGALGLSVAGCAVGSDLSNPTDATAATAATEPSWSVPGESVRHRRTWMAWPSSRDIWGRYLQGVQRDVALVARTIAQYEPVIMCANPGAATRARSLCGHSVRVVTSIPVDDCWMRDSGPIFRTSVRGKVDTIGLNFNGWGGKQTVTRDQYVAKRVARRTNHPWARAAFVGEGGAIETDGDGTVMATESSLVNDNRNPGMSKAEIEAAVLAAYGATKMLWVPGIRGRDITDDHIDATSRFIRPGVVLVQVPPASRTDGWARDARKQFDVLSNSTDAQGRSLTVIPLAGPNSVRSNYRGFLDSYVNFALAKGVVITAQFGDEATDRACRHTLRRAFPRRTVVQLNVDRLHAGGGGIHCITQQEPRGHP
jgi:agmatine deiminase